MKNTEKHSMHKYTLTDTIIANIPYAAMVLIGAATIGYAYGFTPPALAGAGLYVLYGITGAFWIMIFMCPYCAYYGTHECPCGYGMIAAKLVKKGEKNCFSDKFKRHIPVIVPLWVIPAVCGGIILWRSFSWMLVGLVTVFIVESWILLPLVSKKHGCTECPQKEDCPWMGGR